MATNLALDPKLLDEAVAAAGVRTKKEAVTLALEEFIARRARAKIVDLFGTIDMDETYDYKSDRLHRDQRMGIVD
ncbi:MAG: type II toxin-antitoxin system VapB family antitoxin [Actinomycetales bacterium]|nr:type II toxin-antitoxin system VapB family antitoxin [Actinomycetales bacterium]